MWVFLFEVVSISLSGVMSPGPMSAATIGQGSRSPHAGAWMAIGHGVVEFPLMIALFFGAGYLFSLPYVRVSIALLGGAFLLFTGVGMLRAIGKASPGARSDDRSPLLAGILLSVGNPYFLIWWATVGIALILRSVQFGLLGFVVLAVTHWLCDFCWCYFLSALSFKGGNFFGKSFQKAIFAISGVFLIFLSGKFILDAASVLFA